MDREIRILWVDDEIDILKAQIVFLETKGYHVDTANDGYAALEKIEATSYDMVFLDENMPGMSGLEVLAQIKEKQSALPVIMITKSEDEQIMEEALGSRISDYLIKPVNPNQVLLTIKKHIDTGRLVGEKSSADYQTEFAKIGMQIQQAVTFADWVDVYKKLVYWELELAESPGNQMEEVMLMQKSEANNEFCKFVKKNYLRWFTAEQDDKPVLSPSVLNKYVFPRLKKKEKVFFIFIDNLRYDQWLIIYPHLRPFFKIEQEDIFCSILPTVTQYARNAMFSGLMPYEIDKIVPDLWRRDEDEGGKNLFEPELLDRHLQRAGLRVPYHFEKVFNKNGEKKILNSYKDLMNNDLNVLVYNFIDILSHAKTNVQMVKDLADDEASYRSITNSWFLHSYLFEFMKKLADEDVKVVISTDHGSIRVTNPVKVIGDKDTSTNLRFKTGKHLSYNEKEVFSIKEAKKAHLPERNFSWDYIFATTSDFLVYPNNYNHFVNYYKNTFQHGGISMEEMLIPCVTLSPRK